LYLDVVNEFTTTFIILWEGVNRYVPDAVSLIEIHRSLHMVI